MHELLHEIFLPSHGNRNYHLYHFTDVKTEAQKTSISSSLEMKAQSIPSKLKKKKSSLRHPMVKLQNSKDKQKICKAGREKRQTTFKRVTVHLTGQFAIAAMETGK